LSWYHPAAVSTRVVIGKRTPGRSNDEIEWPLNIGKYSSSSHGEYVPRGLRRGERLS
jgi:hypothetical protein